MNRNTRLMIVMGVAVVLAAVATAGVIWVIQHQPRETPDPTVQVVVAAKQLETGLCVEKDQVKLVVWPEKYRPAGAFAKVDDVVKRSLLTAGVENEPITENKLAPRDAGCGLPPTIHTGMRAMSVRVNEVIGVAGFVTPGTRVDVLVTLRESNDSLSRVVVRNVQVLTAGTKYDEAEAKAQGKAIPSTVVTLMVTPADAERIALAANEGQIMLALRNPLDTETSETPGVWKAALMGRPRTAPVAAPRPIQPPRPEPPAARDVVPPPPPPPPPPVQRTVEVIRAGKLAREVLQ